MAGGHVHGQTHTSRVLKLSLALTAVYVFVLVAAGVRAHSLALISEAGHNVSDLLALLLSWVAVVMQTRPPNHSATFGYHRAGVVAAFLNALALAAISFFIFYEAAKRLYAPQAVHPTLMMVVAAIGIALNGVIALALYRTSRDVNIRSAFVHQLGDTMSTAAVLVGGAVIAETGQQWVDPALSFGIGALILWSSYDIVKETLNILLEGTPRGMEVRRILDAIRAVEGVNDVHDLHVWSLGSETHALSCHIAIADIPPSESEAILRRVQERLREKFRIDHTTIQFEHAECDVAHGCVIPLAEHQAREHEERS